ncbi:MAG: citrate lyase beta subunit [Pseudomonadota bacterium]|jgi:citrate lyase subunit beta/citryl-CoA lyase
MSVPRLARSMLFVPATSTRKIDKAYSSAADAVILDLEDAVATAEKPAARGLLREIVAVTRRLPTWVRVNATETAFCLRDLQACCTPGVTGVILPKVESAEQVRAVDWAMAQFEGEAGLAAGSVALMGIVETSRGLVAVDAIAGASPRLSRLLFGAVDLAADMSVEIDDAAGATQQARFAIARASFAARLAPPIDTAFTDIPNLAELRASAARAKALGYGGKTCIHPTQIDAVNEVFSPGAERLAWARRVVEAFAAAERQGLAALRLDGEMLDYPVVERARRLLAQAGG